MNLMFLAAEGDPVWNITNLLSDIPAVFNSVGALIMANPVASVFVGFAVAGAGVRFFKKIIHVR